MVAELVSQAAETTPHARGSARSSKSVMRGGASFSMYVGGGSSLIRGRTSSSVSGSSRSALLRLTRARVQSSTALRLQHAWFAWTLC